MDYKSLRWVRMIFEAPYRVKMYALSKKIYREETLSMTPDEIERIEGYKDIHKGERCFIVLTGPSLTENDLALIKDEICFTVNSGYKAYGVNGWRPQYYVSMDGNEVAQEMLQTVLNGNYDIKGFFTSKDNPITDDKLIKLPSDLSFIWRINSILNKLFPWCWTLGKLSDDIADRVYNGKTVLCATLQIAAYMGFAEIYLLGADFNYVGAHTHSDLTKEVIKRENWDKTKTQTEMLVQMKDFAADAKRKKICIYNATRGGKLECFERVDLDRIIS